MSSFFLSRSRDPRTPKKRKMRRGPAVVLVMLCLKRPRVSYASSLIAPGDGQSFVASETASIPMVFDGKQESVCVSVNAAEKMCIAGSVSSVVLEKVPFGVHSVAVSTKGLETRVSVNVEKKRSDVFEVSYDWREISDSESVPPGCEIRMHLGADDAKKIARIPEPWRLQKFVDDAGVFWRTDVTRTTTVFDLENHLATFLKRPGQRPRLAYGGEPLHPKATAENIDLFRHQHALTLLWQDDDTTVETPREETPAT